VAEMQRKMEAYNSRTFELDPIKVLQQIRYFRNLTKEVRQTFSSSDIFEISYQELITRRNEIAEWLGCDPPLLAEPEIEKQRQKPKTEILTNYDEVRAAFRNSECEWMLEDV